MKHVAGNDKKTILILWWWFPDDPDSIADATVYGKSWDEGVKAEVGGIGGFNFSRTFKNSQKQTVTNILSTYGQPSGPVPDLWKEVKCKIDPDLPECLPS